MDGITRKTATAQGLKRYFTGKPCPRGHVAERLVSGRRCLECSRERDKGRYAKNPEKERERSLLSGWKRNKYPAPTRPRPDACEMCGGPATARRLHLDHNHTTKKFRGWLCHYCNTDLGRLGDSVERVKQALVYLQKAEFSPSLPSDAQERKAIPLASGVWDYFPAALIEVAKVSYQGNIQHNGIGAPLHWARGKSTDQADTLLRHFLERGAVDIDGIRHSAKLAWRALALLQLELEAEGAPLAPGARLPKKSSE